MPRLWLEDLKTRYIWRLEDFDIGIFFLSQIFFLLRLYLILLTRPLLVKFYLWTPANFVWLIWKKNFCLVLSIVNCRLIVDWFWFWFWLSSIKLGFICRWPLAKSKKKLFFLKKKFTRKFWKFLKNNWKDWKDWRTDLTLQIFWVSCTLLICHKWFFFGR